MPVGDFRMAASSGWSLLSRKHLVPVRRPTYIGKVMRTYLKALEVRHLRTRSHHPQTTGKIERAQRTVKEEVALVTPSCPETHLIRRILLRCLSWYSLPSYIALR